MFEIRFKDSVHGEQVERFETFAQATEYWEDFADTPTCISGELIDLDNGEIIWAFEDGSQEG